MPHQINVGCFTAVTGATVLIGLGGFLGWHANNLQQLYNSFDSLGCPNFPSDETRFCRLEVLLEVQYDTNLKDGKVALDPVVIAELTSVTLQMAAMKTEKEQSTGKAIQTINDLNEGEQRQVRTFLGLVAGLLDYIKQNGLSVSVDSSVTETIQDLYGLFQPPSNPEATPQQKLTVSGY